MALQVGENFNGEEDNEGVVEIGKNKNEGKKKKFCSLF